MSRRHTPAKPAKTAKSAKSAKPARSGKPGNAAAAPRIQPPADGAACPCGLDAAYGDCCGRFHRGEGTAPSAERLMRSRYSAFVAGDAAYLLRTWHPDTRPERLELDPKTRWLGLEVLETSGGGAFHSEGTVRFRARFREAGREGAVDEHSTFVRLDGAWVYVTALGD
ncbi:YchJ family protein [Yinghuangia soli]|uniref:UPF0225 protein LZ495_13020 n=1 Tax=Yinghuangia soli TaxID=2908204 RepID=A0AA41PYA1_9ACTN|nr:YchJ family protein [Yinghuangia soli]MCF2528139.1 YchJ family protein [Yinghuangia soli]